jgi:YrbI family 3-deoxy-D-manno-octulosonate 8-phosphate phosphatase
MSMAAKPWPRIEDLHTIILDFDGVFTDNKVYVDGSGTEVVRCDRADGLAVDFLRRYRLRAAADLDVFILSTERDPVVAARARKLQLPCEQGVGDKLAFVTAYLERRRPGVGDPFAGMLCLANDLNDLPLMQRVGFSVVPDNAHPLVKRLADAVLPERGGDGFVRAVVERLLGIPEMTLEEIGELVSDR